MYFTHRCLAISGSSPDGIAVDPVAQLVFYSESGPNRISMAKLDGSDRLVIISNAADPRSICLDPQYR